MGQLEDDNYIECVILKEKEYTPKGISCNKCGAYHKFREFGNCPNLNYAKSLIKVHEKEFLCNSKEPYGDCVDKIYRQAVTAAGMGCMAALDAEKWLTSKK